MKPSVPNFHHTQRQVTRHGVSFLGSLYRSQALEWLWRSRPRLILDIWFDPDDCTAIYAENPDDGRLIRLRVSLEALPKVSFECMKVLREAHAAHVREGKALLYADVIDRLMVDGLAASTTPQRLLWRRQKLPWAAGGPVVRAVRRQRVEDAQPSPEDEA